MIKKVLTLCFALCVALSLLCASCASYAAPLKSASSMNLSASRFEPAPRMRHHGPPPRRHRPPPHHPPYRHGPPPPPPPPRHYYVHDHDDAIVAGGAMFMLGTIISGGN